jgi:hypothetical protein
MATVAVRIGLGPRVPLDLPTQICADVNSICALADALDRQTARNASRLLADEQYSSLVRNLQQTRRQLNISLEESARTPKVLQVQLYELFEQLDQFAAFASSSAPRDTATNAEAAVYLNLTRALTPTPAVLSLRYGSPFELILSNPGWVTGAAGSIGLSFWRILVFIRDFSAKREKGWAEARKVHGEAEDAEAEARKKHADADRLEAEADEAHTRAMEARTIAQFRSELTETLLTQVRDGVLLITPEQIESALSEESISAAFRLSQEAFDFEALPEEERIVSE